MQIPSDYLELFEKFSLGENQYLLNLLQGTIHINYPFGYLFGKLSEKDSDILYLVNDLQQNKFHDNEFKDFILSLEKATQKKEAESLIIRIKEYDKIRKQDCISIKKLESITTYLEKLDFEKFTKYYASIYSSFSDEPNIFNCTAEEYVVFNALELMYQYHKSTKRFAVPKNNTLEQTYLSKGINLEEVDLQYSKHKLLTIDENFTVSDSNISKVYDNRIGGYVLIDQISCELMKFLNGLMNKGLIGVIALRPNYSVFGIGISDLSIALEELERGKVFSFENLGAPSVTKLYSKSYDILWISIDKQNITFEEIVQDFDVYRNSIVTQVVHLEYVTNENSEQIITHIDHEYIFYTEDEFMERQTNNRQKGNARKRYKTFKIDKSKIPFVVDEMCVLYYIIGNLFKEKELLEEYFKEVI